jgi:hypothetical protein
MPLLFYVNKHFVYSIKGRSTKFVLDVQKDYITDDGICRLEIEDTIFAALIDLFIIIATKFNLAIINNRLQQHINEAENMKSLSLILRALANLIPLKFNCYTLMIAGILIKFLQNLLGNKSDFLSNFHLEALLKLDLVEELGKIWMFNLILHSFRLLVSLLNWIGIESLRNAILDSDLENLAYAFEPLQEAIPPLKYIIHDIRKSFKRKDHIQLHERGCEVGLFIKNQIEGFKENSYELGKIGMTLKQIYNLNCCAYCNKGTLRTLKLCSKCKKVLYCNKDCQKAHFQMHKHSCKP